MSTPKLLAAALLVVLPSVAAAANGAIKINHTCATVSGCFAGDGAGYPVTITQTGSYALTSDLVIEAGTIPSGGGISVAANFVSIDLRGFSIMKDDCVGANAGCLPPPFIGPYGVRTATGSGGFDYVGTSVRNGSIVGMNQGGSMGPQALATDLTLVRNWDGMEIGAGSRIQNCVVETSASLSPSFALERATIATQNLSIKGGGLLVSPGSVVTHNSMSHSDGAGFFDVSDSDSGFLGGAVVLGNSSYQNAGAGFWGLRDGMAYSTIVGNTAYGNGTNPFSSSLAGIHARWSLVHGNTLRGNAALGFESEGAAYGENVINGNAGGTVGGSGAINLGANSCNGTATCP